MTRSEQKRLAIIEAAKDEFIQNGFSAANMNNVCANAEVSKRTLYRHFESKECLFEEVLVQIQESVVRNIDYPFDEQTPLEEQLRLVTLREIDVMYNIYGIALSRTIIMEFFRQPDLAKSVTERLYRTRSVSTWFEKALASGKLEAGDAQTITSVYVSIFQGLLFWPYVLDILPQPEQEELDRKIDLIVTTIVRAFAP
ncbi:TetR/AcrR family transcriptional regulator [Vibrio renipiscarius]|uniref:TetR family transcriptional regulator n=1 Tax=Vibrio renipiscarius TaxID=1461322 RepID=A0A0C2NZN2_9VIBR|nr:TetR/AcrR family transcriptional regulator [Vibrio renipiscarius]KII79627.1 TetR family transcriptional regulator [Vibrio renipiscarius]KII80745.1 TetR family transcriptional regulator [Vibrio renipiscarius]